MIDCCEICGGFAESAKEYRAAFLHVRLCWEHQLDLDALLHDAGDRLEQLTSQVHDYRSALCGLAGDGKARDRIIDILGGLHAKVRDARVNTAAEVRNWIAEQREEWLTKQAERDGGEALRKAEERIQKEAKKGEHGKEADKASSR